MIEDWVEIERAKGVKGGGAATVGRLVGRRRGVVLAPRAVAFFSRDNDIAVSLDVDTG